MASGSQDKKKRAREVADGILLPAVSHQLEQTSTDGLGYGWQGPADTRALIELLPALVFVTDARGGNVFTNRRFREYTGLTATELLGDGWLMALHPDDRARAADIWRPSIDTEEPYEAEYRVRAADGEHRWHIVRATVIGGEGDEARWIGTCTDIDDQKRQELVNETAADSSEEQLRLLIDAATDTAVFMLDPDGRIATWNTGAERIKGWTAQDAIGQPYAMLFLPEDREAGVPEVHLAAAIEGGQFAERSRRVRADGGSFDAQVHLTALYRPDGGLRGFVKVTRDVTEQAARDAAQSFRLKLTERLQTLADPEAMMDAACALLGQHLGVAQVGFADTEADQAHIVVRSDWNDGRIELVLGRWRMDDFGPYFIGEMKAGKTIVIPDISDDPRTNAADVLAAYTAIGTRAILDRGLIRDGRMLGMLFIHHPEPREWTADEVALVEEVTERLWAALERAQAHAMLAESERKLALFVEHSPAAIAMFDEQMRYVAASRRYTRDYGLPDGAIIAGRSHYEVFPEIPQHWRDIHARVLAGEELSEEEEAFNREDGSVDWISWVMTPWHSADGSLGGALLYSEVKTQQVDARHALSNAEALYRSILQHQNEALCRFRIDGTLILVNDAYAAFFGKTADELAGTNFYDLIPPADVEQVRSSIANLSPEVPAETIAHRVLAPDGSIRVMQWTNRRLPQRPGEEPVYQASGRDITDHVEADQALHRQLERAELLLDVSRDLIGSHLDEAGLAAAVFERVAPSLGADSCFSYRLDAAAGCLALVFERGVPQSQRAAAERLELDQAFCGTVAASCRAIAADADRIASDPKGAFVHAMGVTAYACHPLMASDGRLLGTFSLASTSRAAIAPEDVAFHQTIANMLAQAWERCAAERELRQGEALLTAVTDNASVGLALLDRERRYTFANATYSRILDLPADLVGKGPAEVLGPVYADQIAPRLDRAFAGESVNYELTRPDVGDRSARHYTVRYDPLRNGGGVVEGVTVSIVDTTERKQYEDRIRESEEFNRSLMEGSADCIKVLDSDGQLRLMNAPGLCAMEIDDFAPLCGADWASLWPDEARDEIALAVAKARAGEVHSFEALCPTAKGTPKWWDVTVSPVRGGDGAVVRLLSVSRDVTERRLTDEALLQRAAQLELLARTSSILLSEQEPGGELLGRIFSEVAAHLRFESFYHYRDGVEPRTLRLDACLGVSDEDRRQFGMIHYGEMLCGRVAETRQRLIVEDLQISTHPGSELLAAAGATSYAGFPLTAGGELFGTVAFISRRHRHLREGEVQMVQTVCEQIATALDRAASDARFRSLGNSIPALLFVSDPDGRNTFVNQSFVDYAGLAFDEFLGDGWLRVIHPDDAARAAATWEASWRDGQTYVAEYRFRRADGEFRWHLVRGVPVCDEAGRIVEWFGTCTDNHDFVAAREELANSRIAIEQANADLEARVAARTAELQRANARLRKEIARREATQAQLAQAQKLEALGQLTSGIAHDFNNVIAAISGGFDLIARRSSDARIGDISRHGVAAAQRGGQLVKQLLAFARQQVLEPRNVDVCALLDEARPLLAQTLGPGIVLELDCPKDLPAIRVDPVQLETALINLAANARDAMPDGGTLSIQAAACPSGNGGRPVELEGVDALALRVADTGCGMAPEVLQRVMEPFFTTKAVGRGTGLGMAMVHGFAAQSSGALRIESHAGSGTAVTLWLPALPPGTVADPDRAAGPVEAVPMGSGESILLVDDDDAVRSVTAAQLAELGYRVVKADGGAMALRLLAESEYDLVLSDVVMPEMDGVTMAELMREKGGATPVVFMTGHADRNRLAGEAVLDKPFGFDALARSVAHHLADAAVARDQDEALDRLGTRLKADCLRVFFDSWRAAKGARPMPPFADFRVEDCTEPHRLVIVEVDAAHVPMRFHVAHLGDELARAQDRILPDAEFDATGEDGPASLEAAYRRCVRNRRPSYDYARIDLGDGTPEAVERLILPWTSDGETVDKLVALVVLSDGLIGRRPGEEDLP